MDLITCVEIVFSIVGNVHAKNFASPPWREGRMGQMSDEITERFKRLEQIIWHKLPNSINSPADELIIDALTEIFFILEAERKDGE